MQAVKSIARSAPRSFARTARLTSRTYVSPVAARSWTPALSKAPLSAARFSTSKPQLQVSEELVAKLQSEITYEQDVQAEQAENTSIKDYLNSSEYQLEDAEGSEEVHLVRSYGDEQIKVTFSTESFSNPDADMEATSDPALYDESAPEKRAEEHDEDDETAAGYQVQVSVQVSRQGRGALVLACYLDQDARFNIEHVAYFPTADMAEGRTADAEMSRRGVYSGPPYEELDEGLQAMFEEYLRERGVDEAMGVFIPTYVEMKESQEYVRWMQNVAKFVE